MKEDIQNNISVYLHIIDRLLVICSPPKFHFHPQEGDTLTIENHCSRI